MSGRSGEKFLSLAFLLNFATELKDSEKLKIDYHFFWFLKSFDRRHKVNLVIAGSLY